MNFLHFLRLSFLVLVALWLAPAARAVEERSVPDPVEGVPAIYQPLFRGGLTEDELKKFGPALPYESITLERTPCYGPCPVYTVTFYRSGKVEFLAKENLPKKGEFVGTLDVLSYGRLCYLLDRFHFADFKENYRGMWTDDTTCIVTATTSAGQVKKVSDYGTVGPIELWTIQQTLDGFRERIDWKPR